MYIWSKWFYLSLKIQGGMDFLDLFFRISFYFLGRRKTSGNNQVSSKPGQIYGNENVPLRFEWKSFFIAFRELEGTKVEKKK